MTTQAEELLGVQVTGIDGKVIGTVEQVFEDDADGSPAWARIRAGRTSRFVPLGSSQVTKDGLSVPFEAQTILTGPKVEVGQHMSGEQADELGRYYGLAVPEQPEQGETQQRDTQQRGKAEDQAQQRGGGKTEEQAQQRGKAEDDWLLRREERLKVDKEMLESGQVKIHRYVDEEPAEQTVHLFHEEYDVERVPVSADEGTDDNIEEGERQITLHEERGIASKETVPVERIRLVSKRIDEDETFRETVKRERIEVEPEEVSAGGGRGRNKSRS